MDEKADVKRAKSKRKILYRGKEMKFGDVAPEVIARALRKGTAKTIADRRAEMEKKFAKRS
jgi:hypothetical protein